eukprot:786837-Rhodomonas_salina.1
MCRAVLRDRQPSSRACDVEYCGIVWCNTRSYAMHGTEIGSGIVGAYDRTRKAEQFTVLR